MMAERQVLCTSGTGAEHLESDLSEKIPTPRKELHGASVNLI